MNIQFSPVRFAGTEVIKVEIKNIDEDKNQSKNVDISATSKPAEVATDEFVQSKKSQDEQIEKTNITQEIAKPAETKKHDKYVDPLLTWPWRALGYTNDLGVAISEVAPKLSLACWIPAFLYFGADIYDKYKNKGDEYNPNGQRMLQQAIFQAIASIAFPFVVGHFGSSLFSTVDKFKGEKLSSNAKEQALDDIKEFITRHDIYGEKKEDEQTIMKTFQDEFEKSYDHKKQEYEEKGFFKKALDYVFGGSKDGAKPNADKEKLTNYALDKFRKLKADCNSTKVLKGLIEKEAFKLKLWKSAGSFAALIASVSFIDKFTENVIIHKCVEPGLEQINHSHKKDAQA